MIKIKLLPCPFCGSDSIDPEGWMSCEPDGSDKKTGPACDDCGASAASDERWNTRDWAPEDTDSRSHC